jgi:GNAT superfamily N-acetyltransferase
VPLTIVPANQASCDDLEAVFGARGPSATCWCQRYKLAPGEAFKHYPPDVRRERLREQTGCGVPQAPATSGLIAHLDGEPVGWCAVEPRPAYFGLARVYRVPWDGRAEDKSDPSVWAVTCILVRAGFRGRGISYGLARAAVDFARERGARALEAYPMITRPGQKVIWDEIHVGTVGVFAAAGLTLVHQPTIRRAVMRIDF